jgi:aldose sugar dehydrogenase
LTQHYNPDSRQPFPFILIFTLVLVFASVAISQPALATDNTEQPVIHDNNMTVQVVFEGLKFPTSMAFLGPDDILILEKNEGTVNRIVNGVLLPEPLLDVNVSTESERGMLGIAVAEGHLSNTAKYVFLYFTEAESTDAADALEGKTPLGNRVYRYELVDGKLINPKLILDLPSKERKYHNGGDIEIGPDNNLYIAVGSVASDKIDNNSPAFDNSKILNVKDGPDADGRGGILRVTQDGKSVTEEGIIGDEYPLNLYYAYGIRNSFGIDFDPVTGYLWDTENGPGNGDEINLVEPGFNSGWKVIPGGVSSKQEVDIEEDLVNFNGRGKYSNPEFTWDYTVAPTEITFLNSDKYGKQYENDIFLGDYNNGYIYHFDLDEKRTGLTVDKIEAKSLKELRDAGIVFGEGFSGFPTKGQGADVIFNQGFGGITDLEVGPDGYLYIVSIGKGTIYRIVPSQE